MVLVFKCFDMPDHAEGTCARETLADLARLLYHEMNLDRKSRYTRKVELTESAVLNVGPCVRRREKPIDNIDVDCGRERRNRSRALDEVLRTLRNARWNDLDFLVVHIRSYSGFVNPNIRGLRNH